MSSQWWVLTKGSLQKRGSPLYSQAPFLFGKNINEIWIRIRHQEGTAATRGNFNCVRLTHDIQKVLVQLKKVIKL